MFMHGNPWWSRIWTVQEAILPPSCTLLWGSLSFAWDTLRKAAANLCGEKSSLTWRSREMRAALDKHSALIDGFMYPVRGLVISGGGESPLHLLQRWRYRNATEPRDKLYGLMGLFPAESIPELESGYLNPTGKLFGALTMALIKMERSLRPLVGFRGEPQVTPDIPSWALDLVKYDYGCATRPWKWWNHSHRYDKFDASRGRAVDFDGDYARGIFFDYIADVGDVLGPETWDDLSDQTLIQTVRSWESLLKKPTVSDQMGSKGMYSGGGSTDDAFWRTMLGNLIMAEFPVAAPSNADRAKYDAFLETGIRTKVYNSLRDMVINQAFFITKTGYMGIGPPNIAKQDEIWVLDGGNVPFVLRRESNGGSSRRFIGDAYVHGIMHGQAVNDAQRRAAIRV
ncbi:heterokaryon incompatibility protein 6, OR allele [Rhypophila decipiens]